MLQPLKRKTKTKKNDNNKKKKKKQKKTSTSYTYNDSNNCYVMIKTSLSASLPGGRRKVSHAVVLQLIGAGGLRTRV